MTGIPDRHVPLQEEVPEDKRERSAADMIMPTVQGIVCPGQLFRLEKRTVHYIRSRKETLGTHYTVPRSHAANETLNSCAEYFCSRYTRLKNGRLWNHIDGVSV